MLTYALLLAGPWLVRRLLESRLAPRALVLTYLASIAGAALATLLLLVSVFLRYLPHAVLDRTGLVCKVAVACQRALPGWANATFSFFLGGVLLGLAGFAVYAVLSQTHCSAHHCAHALGEAVLYRGPLPPGLRGRTFLVDDEAPRSYTVGILRPRVVVSVGLLAGMDDQEVQAVFAHEEGHLAARDNLILLVARTLAATFALLPGVRSAVARLRRAQELAADDFAGRRTGDPLAVASSLQKFARALVPGTTSPGLAFADEGDVVERIRGLVFGQVAVTSRRYLAATVVVVTVLLFSFTGSALAFTDVTLRGGAPTHTCHEGTHSVTGFPAGHSR